MKKRKNIIKIILALMILPNIVLADCNAIFTQEAWEFVNDIFDIIKVAAPILLIVLLSADIFGAITSGREDGMNAALDRSKKRIIATILVFLVPTIVKLVFNLEPVKINLNLVDDPTCGIGTNKRK